MSTKRENDRNKKHAMDPFNGGNACQMNKEKISEFKSSVCSFFAFMQGKKEVPKEKGGYMVWLFFDLPLGQSGKPRRGVLIIVHKSAKKCQECEQGFCFP